MKRRDKIIIGIVVACLGIIQLSGCSDSREYRQRLYELQSKNQADTIFRSDSLQRELVRHFDRHGSKNEQMLAHYLLGRAYADMGKTPQAIEAYQQALEYADTTRSDCDLLTLRSIYGQIAYVFYTENVPEKFIEAENKYIDLAWKRRDTIDAVVGITNLKRAYNLLNDTDMIMSLTDSCTRLFQEYGRPDLAARNQCAAAYFDTERHNYSKAKERIDLIRKDADIFKDNGDLILGCEDFYYTLGCYFNGINLLDSAEYYFRKTLANKKYEEGYRGLLSVYDKLQISDSVRLFARLYADANDARHREMNSNKVILTSALFDYTHHQQQALANMRKAKRRMILIYGLTASIVIILFALLWGARHYKLKLQEKRKHLHQLSTSYADIQRAYQAINQEMSLVKDDFSHFVEHKQREIEAIIQQKSEIEQKYNQLAGKDKKTAYYTSDIVLSFQKRSLSTTIVPPTEEDWHILQTFFAQSFPRFYTFATQRANLSQNEWRVILLTHLDINPGVIAQLMNINAPRVTSLKNQINNVLFRQKGATTMVQNLKAAINSL